MDLSVVCRNMITGRVIGWRCRQMQTDILYFIVSIAGVLVGGIVLFLFQSYRFRGEDQLALKTEGAGFDYTRPGVWYAQHVTRPRDLFVYTLTQIVSAVGSTFLFWLLLSPSTYYSFWGAGAEFLCTWFMIALMCLCGQNLNSCYEYWGAGKPCPKDDDLEPDEVDTC